MDNPAAKALRALNDGWISIGSPNIMQMFVLRNGVQRSGQVLLDGIDLGVPKQCFMNATHLALDRQDLTYVEGYAVRNDIGFPIHHAWVEDADGRVIDNTWVDTDQCSYIGVRIDNERLRHSILMHRVYGVLEVRRGYNLQLMQDLDAGLYAAVDAVLKKGESTDADAGNREALRHAFGLAE